MNKYNYLSDVFNQNYLLKIIIFYIPNIENN